MEIRPACAIPECGGLGVYRCGVCQSTYCPRHATVVSDASPHGAEGPWRVRCIACHVRQPLESPWWQLPAAEEHETAVRGGSELDDNGGGQEWNDAADG